MTKRKRGGAPAKSDNGSPTETEKIQKKMAAKREKKAKTEAAPDVRDLNELETAQAQAMLAEKKFMEERKKVLQLQEQLLKAQQVNLQLQADAHNREAGAMDQERNNFLASLGVKDGDKADLADGKLIIQRGADKK